MSGVPYDRNQLYFRECRVVRVQRRKQEEEEEEEAWEASCDGGATMSK